VIYALRKLVEADFTVAAINAQLAILNTLYTLTVPNIVTVADGAVTVVGGLLPAAFPLVLHYIGTQPVNGEPASFGKRDVPDWPLLFTYHTRRQDLALARRDSEVTLEALLPLYEGLMGKAFGATLRQIVEIGTFSPTIEVFDTKDQAVVRIGGVLRGSVIGRTQGV